MVNTPAQPMTTNAERMLREAAAILLFVLSCGCNAADDFGHQRVVETSFFFLLFFLFSYYLFARLAL